MDIYFSGYMYIYIYAYTSVDITTTLGYTNIDVENPWFP